ncbi:hypothetical protein C5167_006680 [Papaver somniferum]|uniref:WRKY domain-containing protein n=1 Tax=Papaver somniferum TaxID=3469 RepID=A0A4Y7JE45_PAPSO|nr:probable WRKY transcription factor 45 [Papaver somniferum]RZC59373.1 hypothetical protein C5167_006680 [Papaver somniferum]
MENNNYSSSSSMSPFSNTTSSAPLSLEDQAQYLFSANLTGGGGFLEQLKLMMNVPSSKSDAADHDASTKSCSSDENGSIHKLATATNDYDSAEKSITTNTTSTSTTTNDDSRGQIKEEKIKKKIKKAKYAFQTRSHVDILDDGYRWRKYGQKSVKNNLHPRSYYRCTHQGCNVKKQVQRLSRDEGIVVTTYEGMHSHPIQKSTDNFEHILNQMQIYPHF